MAYEGACQYADTSLRLGLGWAGYGQGAMELAVFGEKAEQDRCWRRIGKTIRWSAILLMV